MRKVSMVARGLSALQKATLDFAYKRRLERLERPPSRFGPPEFDFIPAHIVNYYYGFPGTYPHGNGIAICGNSFRTKGYSFQIDDEWIDGEQARVLCNKYRVTVHKSIKRLEQRGLISKLSLSEVHPSRFGYALTEKGVELMANNTQLNHIVSQ